MNFTERKRKVIRDIDSKTEYTKQQIPYEVFENVPDKIKINDNDLGKRVWFIDEARTEKITIKEINDDHYVISYRTGQERAVFKGQVILHPKEWRGRI